MNERLLISLCTFNECENLPPLVEEIFKQCPDAHLLIIDDNSPDGTGKIADAMAEDNPQVFVIHREGKLGLGTATLCAFRYACEKNYHFLINMDADFSHSPKYLPALSEAAQTCDVAIGSRYTKGGGVEGWGIQRYLMSWCVNTYSRWLLGLKPKDCSGSYRCYRIEKLSLLDFAKFRSTGYAIQEEILYRLKRVGAKFQETPIVFEDRKWGESKISKIDAIEAVWVIFRLFCDRLFGVSVQYPPQLPSVHKENSDIREIQ